MPVQLPGAPYNRRIRRFDANRWPLAGGLPILGSGAYRCAPLPFWVAQESSNEVHKPIKYAEKAFTYAAGAAWAVFDKVNQIRQNPGFIPSWSEKPLLKSYEKTKPPLGWPRETDSLCPRCVPEIRKRILDGETPIDILYNDRPGEIKAQVIERDGKILMVKDCPIHGHFEDVMAIDTAF